MRILIVTAKEDTERPDVLDTLIVRDMVAKALASVGHKAYVLGVTKKDLMSFDVLENKIKRFRPDCIFNLFEGFSDDSKKEILFATFLESLNIPFTGNGSAALQASLDKLMAKKLLTKKNVPAPKGLCLESTSFDLEGLPCPAFIKPRFEDGSVGIDDSSLVTSKSQLIEAVARKILTFPAGIIVEEFLEGREFNVGLIGLPPYEVAGISMIDYEDYPEALPFLDYGAKWDTKSPGYRIAPENPKFLAREMKDSLIWMAKRAGIALSCKGYFRVDMRERDGQIYVIDVNPNPDLNVESGLANQCRRSGLPYEALISYIIDTAIKESQYESDNESLYEVSRHSAIY